MRKTNLKLIHNPMNSYRFSLTATYTCAVIELALAVGLIGLLCYFAVNDSDFLITVIIAVIAVPWLILGVVHIKSGNLISRTVKYGEKVQGEIISCYRFEEKIHLFGRNHRNFTVLIVRFYYSSKKTKPMKTSEFYCNVNVSDTSPDVFGSAKCDVYIYDGRIFVTDFVRRRKGEPVPDIPRLDENQYREYCR